MFTDTLPGGIACVSEEFEFTPIATQQELVVSEDIISYGSAIVSALANPAVTNLSQIAGKQIGVGFVQSPGTFQLAQTVHSCGFCRTCGVPLILRTSLQYLLERSINIYTDIAQAR